MSHVLRGVDYSRPPRFNSPVSQRSRTSASQQRILVIDVSNSFTKFAVARAGRLGAIHRIPTPQLTAITLRDALGPIRFDRCALSSVVPKKNRAVRSAVSCTVLEIGPNLDLGVGIDYPDPASIGADRLANAAAAVALHGSPAIVVDFGTAVTFDVISSGGSYVGGVIAPGLTVMSEYLHHRTALLPLITLAEPLRAVGKSTNEAMLSGAVHGYRGLVKEILVQVRREAFGRRRPAIIATGGDAMLIAGSVPRFDVIAPDLTLHGIRIIAERNA